MQLKKWQGRLINKEELHVSKVNHFLLGFPGPGSKAPLIAALLVVSKLWTVFSRIWLLDMRHVTCLILFYRNLFAICKGPNYFHNSVMSRDVIMERHKYE